MNVIAWQYTWINKMCFKGSNTTRKLKSSKKFLVWLQHFQQTLYPHVWSTSKALLWGTHCRLPEEATLKLDMQKALAPAREAAQALVIVFLDYCKSLLTGAPVSATRPLQLVWNAAALMFPTSTSLFITLAQDFGASWPNSTLYTIEIPITYHLHLTLFSFSYGGIWLNIRYANIRYEICFFYDKPSAIWKQNV